jgi:hypothetical protein
VFLFFTFAKELKYMYPILLNYRHAWQGMIRYAENDMRPWWSGVCICLGGGVGINTNSQLKHYILTRRSPRFTRHRSSCLVLF